MHTYADQKQENNSQSVANSFPKQQSNNQAPFQLADNLSQAVAQRELQEMANKSPHVKQLRDVQALAANNNPQAAQLKKNNPAASLQGKFEPIQKKENKTGLPDQLKSGVENLSGYSLDNVKVHYNSSRPAQLNAHAFAQGSDIHVAPGQEKHLPHEAWHVVQQAQGRVKPTIQLKEGIPVNDDAGLENEADLMGAKAISGNTQLVGAEEEELLQGKFEILQRQVPEEEEMLQGKFETLQLQETEEEEEMLQGKFETSPSQLEPVIQEKKN